MKRDPREIPGVTTADKLPAKAEGAAADLHDWSAEVTTTVLVEGREFAITKRVDDIRRLKGYAQQLDRHGLAPPPRADFARTPEGLPICGKHQAVMRKRDKQGDAWYSHKVIGPDGAELWCKGYHDPRSSPGYDVEVVS